MRTSSPYWMVAGGVIVTVAGFFTIRNPLLAGEAGAALALLLLTYWARNSMARLGGLGILEFLVIPVVIPEARTPQFIVLTVTAIVGLAAALRLSRRRHVGNHLAAWTVIVPSVLSAITVGLAGFDQLRLLAGICTGVLLAFGITVAKAGTPDEIRGVGQTIVFIACITAVLAVIEDIRQQPLIEFTAFQVNDNPGVAFRASVIYGHPLVLSVFSLAAALYALSRPQGVGPWWFQNRLVSVGLPVVGVIASVSRSAVLVAGVGLLAMLVSRHNGDVPRSRRLLPIAFAAAAGTALWTELSNPGSSLAERFGELTPQEQSIRLSALATVGSIVHGLGIFIGGGPRFVNSLLVSDSAVRFGTLDDQFLDVYADFGIVGALGLGALVLALLWGLRARISSWHRSMVIAAIAPLTAMLFLDTLAWWAIALIFAFGVGSALSQASLAPPRDPFARQEERIERRWREGSVRALPSRSGMLRP